MRLLGDKMTGVPSSAQERLSRSRIASKSAKYATYSILSFERDRGVPSKNYNEKKKKKRGRDEFFRPKRDRSSLNAPHVFAKVHGINKYGPAGNRPLVI